MAPGCTLRGASGCLRPTIPLEGESLLVEFLRNLAIRARRGNPGLPAPMEPVEEAEIDIAWSVSPNDETIFFGLAKSVGTILDLAIVTSSITTLFEL